MTRYNGIVKEIVKMTILYKSKITDPDSIYDYDTCKILYGKSPVLVNEDNLYMCPNLDNLPTHDQNEL